VASTESAAPARPDYGLDAPGVVRNLCVAAGAGLLAFLTAAFGLWSGRLALPLGPVRLVFPLAQIGVVATAGCGSMAIWMVWSRRVGKARERERLLDLIAWRGDERVLDVGCGRGLMLVGAAKRLRTGTVTGIDIWQAEDLSGNAPDAALTNAAREGVADRVEVRTADMRAMPFPDATFDVVVSRAAIHNLYSPADRAKAIAEIARVLKPGGRALIDDIRHHREYAVTFAAHGCRDVQWFGSAFTRAALAVVTVGALRPAVILVTKER